MLDTGEHTLAVHDGHGLNNPASQARFENEYNVCTCFVCRLNNQPDTE